VACSDDDDDDDDDGEEREDEDEEETEGCEEEEGMSFGDEACDVFLFCAYPHDCMDIQFWVKTAS